MAFRNRIVRMSQLIADSIIGAFFATADDGNRIEIGKGEGDPDSTIKEIRFFSGSAEEVNPAAISAELVNAGTGNERGQLHIRGFEGWSGPASHLPSIDLYSPSANGGVPDTGIVVDTDSLTLLTEETTLIGGVDMTDNLLVEGTSEFVGQAVFDDQITALADINGAGYVRGDGVGSFDTLELGGSGPGSLLGRSIKGIDFGFGSFTTDASGRITIGHNLGNIPTFCMFMPQGAGQRGFYVIIQAALTGTQIVFECYTAANVIRGSGVVLNGHWLAILTG